MNASTDVTPFPIVSTIIGIAELALIIIGIFGNVFIILIYIFMKIKTFTKLFLVSEAVWDIFVLLFPSIRYYLMVIYDFEIRHMNSISCKFYSFFGFFSTDMSAWILIVLSVERYLVLKFPLSYRLRTINRNHGIFLLVMLILIGLVKDGFYLTASFNPVSGKCFSLSQEVAIIMSEIDLVFNLLVPSTIILFCTIGSIYLILSSSRRITPNNKNQKSKNPISEILKIILAISIFSFVSSTPICVLSIILNYEPSLRSIDPVIIISLDISRMLYMSNNSLKCYLYLLFSRKFRQKFIALCLQFIGKLVIARTKIKAGIFKIMT